LHEKQNTKRMTTTVPELGSQLHLRRQSAQPQIQLKIMLIYQKTVIVVATREKKNRGNEKY